jgi:beta-lactamase regulating signal transducer with metallopeptidase domain
MSAALLARLEDVFGGLLTASWQASVLALLVLALQGALGERLNPRWRYALWLLVVGRLLLPVQPESALSLFRFTPAPPATFIAPMTEPLFAPPPLAAPLPVGPLVTVEPGVSFSFFSVLALVWLAGAMILFVLTWRVNARFARQVSRSPEIGDPALLRLFAASKNELNIRRSIRLVESGQVQSPAIMGLFHPTLLLPARVREKFDATELRLIFLHELAHLKRGDVIVQGIIALLQILHWFNPVLWFSFRRMRLDREPAADALVLSRTGEAERERYGLMLLKLLEHFNQRHSLPTLVGILEEKDQFKRRFTLIARFTRGAYGWSTLGAVLLVTLALLTLTKTPVLAASLPFAQAKALGVSKVVSAVVVTETKELVGDVGRLYHAMVYTQTSAAAPSLGPTSYQFIADMSNNTFPVTGGSVSLPTGSGWATNPVALVEPDLLVGAHYLHVQGFKSEADLLANFPNGQYAFNIQSGVTGEAAYTAPVTITGTVPYPPIAPVITNKTWDAGFLVLDPESAQITFTNYPGATLTWEIVIPGRSYIMSAGGGGTSFGSLNLTGMLSYGQTYDAQLRFINRDKSSTVSDPNSPKDYGYSTLMAQIVEFKIKTPPEQALVTPSRQAAPSAAQSLEMLENAAAGHNAEINATKASPALPLPIPTSGSLDEVEAAMQVNVQKIAPTEQRFQVLQGAYGANGSWRDVTDNLRKLVKDGALRVQWEQPYSEIGGDPAWLKVKTLVVSYRSDGKTKLKTFQEQNPPIGLRATLP